MKYFAAFLLWVLLLPGISFSQNKTIVVIGSSTSYGYGLTNPATESWVNKMKIYYRDRGIMTDNGVRNLSQTSTNCVTGMPNGYLSSYTATDFRVPDTTRNITAAIKLKPDVIIVSYPTNGYDWMPFNDIISDLAVIKKTAEDAGIRCFIATTQPRNTFGPGERQKLKSLRDTILKKFGNFAIDFWGVLAGPDNGILPQFNLDNVHPNAAGHDELYKQVIAKSLFETAAPTPLPNQPPVAQAGADITITLPVNSLTLSGSGSDPDGAVVSYLWKAVAGPNQYLIATPSSVQTQVSNLIEGKYFFELKVTDNGGLSSTDTLVITVNPAVVVSPPPSPASLPTVYSNISLTKQNEKIILNWTVSNEPKNAFYNIEKSKDSVYFQSIGTVSGTNSVSTSSYSFADEKPFNGFNYYRVTMSAPLNPTLISSVLKSYNSEEAFVITTMNPMPAHEKIQFSIDAGYASTMSFTLFDLGGKQCAFTTYALRTGINTLSYPLYAFSAGIYFIHVSNGRKTQLLKIIRSN